MTSYYRDTPDPGSLLPREREALSGRRVPSRDAKRRDPVDIRRRPRSRALLVGAIVVAVLLAAGVAAVALGGSSDDEPTAVTAGGSGSNPSSTVPPIAALPTKWSVTFTVTDPQSCCGAKPPGTAYTDTWTLRRSCGGGTCKTTARIPTKFGPVVASATGSGLTFRATKRTPQNCPTTGTFGGTSVDTYVFELTGADADGAPTGLHGTHVEDFEFGPNFDATGCTREPDTHEVHDLTGHPA